MNDKQKCFKQRTTWNFRKESRMSKYAKMRVNMIDYISSREFLQLYLMIGTLIPTISDAKDNNIKNWGRQRVLNRSKVSIVHSKWSNVDTNRLQ